MDGGRFMYIIMNKFINLYNIIQAANGCPKYLPD